MFRVMLVYVWHLIRVHLCRIGPEGPRGPAVLAVAESVQRLPEVSRTNSNVLSMFTHHEYHVYVLGCCIRFHEDVALQNLLLMWMDQGDPNSPRYDMLQKS